jgi:hypothetical protein
MTAGRIAEAATSAGERRVAAVERPWPVSPGILAGVSVVAAVAPVVVATVRAVAGGWRAISDNVFFGLRAADVFTEHHPLLGVWTSASVAIGKDVNNPGPLQFDLLALPVLIGGRTPGLPSESDCSTSPRFSASPPWSGARARRRRSWRPCWRPPASSGRSGASCSSAPGSPTACSTPSCASCSWCGAG